MQFTQSFLAPAALTLLALAQSVRAYDSILIQTWGPGTDCGADVYSEQSYGDTGENQQFTAPGLPPGVTEYDMRAQSGDTLPTMYVCPSNTPEGDYTNCAEITTGPDYGGDYVDCIHVHNAPHIQIAE